MPAAQAKQMLRVFLTASFLSSGLLASGLMSGCQSAPSEEDNRLVFFNWWTSPGELAALNKMVAVFSGRYPDVTVENAVVTGGPATDLYARLYDQGLKAGHPPDSYQVHIGAEAQADLPYLQPVDDLYAANGWESVFPPAFRQYTRFNGAYYTVPVNVHRSNVLWYRKDRLASVEKAPPTTWDEFFDLAETLKAAGEEVFVYNPARDVQNPANRVSWTTHHMFESILLAEVGGDRWLGLFDGSFSWTAPEVLEAFAKLKRLLTYAKPMPDGPGYDLTAMTTQDRPAAMALMGDWAEGDLTALGFRPDTDFGWIAAPGTSDYFLFLSDSFPLPKGAPHERNGRRWLEVVGSREGQDAFNQAKGSIPARLDADRSLYDTYHQAAIAEFADRTLLPSLAHGLAANPVFKSRYYEIIGQFVDDGDAAAAAAALAEACTPACQ
jgi:glucose/mannose transport system substrate-binding protein